MSSSPNQHGSSSSSGGKKRKGNDGAAVGSVIDGGGDGDNELERLRQDKRLMEKINERLMEKISEQNQQLERMQERLEILEGRSSPNKDVDEDYFCEEEDGNSGDEDCHDHDDGRCLECLQEKGRALIAYQDMLSRNMYEWEYAPTDNLHWATKDVFDLCKSIKACAVKMRRGEHHYKSKNDEHFLGVLLSPTPRRGHNDANFVPYMRGLKPHWREFADALQDFDLTLDILPDNVSTTFEISKIELPKHIFKMITKALEGKQIDCYIFRHNEFGRYGIRFLVNLLDSNPALGRLILQDNPIDRRDERDLMLAINRHSNIKSVMVNNCCGRRVYLLSEFISRNKLMSINMCNNGLRLSATMRRSLFEYLACNTSLKILFLHGNKLNDADADHLGPALQENNTLQHLSLSKNDFTVAHSGRLFGDALRINRTLKTLILDRQIAGEIQSALVDSSNLNAAADSNHTCFVPYRCTQRELKVTNERNDTKGNRHRKIYNVLVRRHLLGMSNVQHFDDIDVNLLPEVLLAVQMYSTASTHSTSTSYCNNKSVNALSIVHEIMLKWDKALTLYETLGSSCDGA